MTRSTIRPKTPVFLFSLILTASTMLTTSEVKCTGENNVRFVQVQCLRSDLQEDHVFLTPGESITYDAPEIGNGLRFSSIHVQLNSTNQASLRELSSDLNIESYDYFGSFGGWTSNNNFTITNPTASMQELFLKIVRNYVQTIYAVDTVAGNKHTIEFTSGPASDRVFVRWGIFASLKYLEANQSEINVSSLNRTLTPMMVEFLPTYISFHLPLSQRIQETHFLIRLEEKDAEPPAGFCYVSSFLLDHKEISLGPYEEFFFDAPEVTGWNYVTTVAYTNLTTSLYPQPYPFQLVNVAVWEPDTNPLLATAIDTAFGVRNLSNETYSLGFDVVYYYWQNHTGLAFKHEIVENDQESITHKVSANVTNANAGEEMGLIGQYLRFQLPGKTIRFDAPDPVGKYEDSYIPLKQGTYVLTKRESKIVVNTTSEADDLRLANKLRFSVTYDGEAYANAEVMVTQRGLFTSRTYRTLTNQHGDATITIYSNGPEFSQLDIKIAKDKFNYSEQTFNYFAGVFWVIGIALVTVLVAVLAVFLIRKRMKRSCKFKSD